MIWVVDCSFTAALFLPDEFSSEVRSFFSELSHDDQVIIPLLWWYEMANVLVVCEKRNRLKHADIIKIFSLFDKIDFQTDYLHGISYSKNLYTLAKKQDLSSYDATYLELAVRKEANVASLDAQLLQAAVECGLSVYK